MRTLRALAALAVALPLAPFDAHAELTAHCAWDVVRRSSAMRVAAFAFVALAFVAAVAVAQ